MTMKKIALTLGFAAMGSQAFAAIGDDTAVDTPQDFLVGLTLVSECVLNPTSEAGVGKSSDKLDFGEFNPGDTAPVGFKGETGGTNMADDSHIGGSDTDANGGTGFVVKCNGGNGWELKLSNGANPAAGDTAPAASTAAATLAENRNMKNTGSADFVSYTLHCGATALAVANQTDLSYLVAAATHNVTNVTRCGPTVDWGDTTASNTWQTGATGSAVVAVPVQGRLRAATLDYAPGDYLDTVQVTLSAL